MHAVLITFRSPVVAEDLADLLARHVEALQAVAGLVMATWPRDGETLVGFHLFAAHPALAARAVRHVAVLDTPSRATGTPRPVGT